MVRNGEERGMSDSSVGPSVFTGTIGHDIFTPHSKPQPGGSTVRRRDEELFMKRTVIRMLDEAAKNWANDPYALRKTDSGYRAVTFAQARVQVREFATWVLSRGYKKGDNFAIIGEGSPEWIIGEFGLVCAGCVSVPLSIKLLGEEIPFRLNHSGSKAVLTTHNQLEKVLGSFKDVDNKSIGIVYLDEDLEWAQTTASKYGIDTERVTGFVQAREEGRALLAAPGGKLGAELDRIAVEAEEDDTVTICYTSGTTGNPKGIMLTHLNYWTNCHDAVDLFDNPVHFRTLLILPVDHSFAHTVGLYTALICGISLYFVDSRGGGIATLRNIPVNMREANPIFVFTVPALSGNFMKKIISGIEDKGGAIEKIFKAGITAGIARNGNGYDKPSSAARAKAFFPYHFARILIFKKLARMVFGESIRFCVGGGALLDVKQQEFFAALGVPVYQGYGLTEAAPIISSNVPKKTQIRNFRHPREVDGMPHRTRRRDRGTARRDRRSHHPRRERDERLLQEPRGHVPGPARRLALHGRPRLHGQRRIPRRRGP